MIEAQDWAEKGINIVFYIKWLKSEPHCTWRESHEINNSTNVSILIGSVDIHDKTID